MCNRNFGDIQLKATSGSGRCAPGQEQNRRCEQEEKGKAEETLERDRPKGRAGQPGAEHLGRVQNAKRLQQLRPVLHLLNSFQEAGLEQGGVEEQGAQCLVTKIERAGSEKIGN